METETPTQRLAAIALGQPLREFVLMRRPDKSWRAIARDLYVATNGDIDITSEMLRVWYRDEKLKKSSAA